MSAKSDNIHLGRLSIPEGWELRLELSCLEPKSDPPSKLPILKKAQSTPRANLVVSRRPKTLPPGEARKELIETLKKSLRINVEGQGTTDISGTEAPWVRLSFDAPDGLRVVQQHWFREDEGMITQLTATTDHASRAKLDEVLAPLAMSFEPP